MYSYLKQAKMVALMASLIDPIDQPILSTQMKKRNPNKPGPSKEVKERRKRQKQARKQNRKR